MTTDLPMDRRPDPQLPQDFWSALGHGQEEILLQDTKGTLDFWGVHKGSSGQPVATGSCPLRQLGAPRSHRCRRGVVQSLL